jgi:hypothetical protein
VDESVDLPTALILLHGLAEAAVSTRLEPAAELFARTMCAFLRELAARRGHSHRV